MGMEPSGYATQVYDVTEYVNYGGENLICVRADATLEEGWFYEGTDKPFDAAKPITEETHLYAKWKEN